jgi:hypothetical protein
MGSAVFTAAPAVFDARLIQPPSFEDFFHLGGAPEHRRCAAEHQPGIDCSIPAENDRQSHTGQGEVPGTTCPNLAVGTSQAPDRRGVERNKGIEAVKCGNEKNTSQCRAEKANPPGKSTGKTDLPFYDLFHC